jgi:outer membrane protein assembly factor BamB
MKQKEECLATDAKVTKIRKGNPRFAAFASVARHLFCLLMCANGFANDWPQFLGPNRNGISSEIGLLEKFPTNGLPLIWEKAIGTGYSAPSIRDGKLVLFHRVGTNEVVECVNATNGKPVWQFAYPSNFQDPYGYNNGPRCTPLLSENFCYTLGAEGMLICLDLKTGKLVWQRNTAKEWEIPEAFFGVGSSPVLEGDLLLVMIGGQPNSGMVGLNANTGKTIWESVGEKNWTGKPMLGWTDNFQNRRAIEGEFKLDRKTEDEMKVEWKRHEKQASYATPVLATVNGKRMAFCLMRQGLVSLNPKTGEVYDSFWFRARVDESVNAANPIVVSNTVFISAAYYKSGAVWLKVRPEDQKLEEIRRDMILELHWTTPILHNGFLYTFDGRNEPDARFRCVEFATGKLMWNRDEAWRPYSTKQPNKYGRGSCIFADGKLIVLGEGGLLGLFEANPNEAKEISRWQVPQLHYPTWAAPILANKKLYLRSEDRLACFDFKNNLAGRARSDAPYQP